MSVIDQMKTFVKENKVKVILALLLIIIVVIMLFSKEEENNNKVFDNKNYVYTYDTIDTDGIVSKLPYINIENENIDEINKQMAIIYYREDILQEKYMDYKYYKNDNIISLIVELYYIGSNDFAANNYFYNIDKSTGKIITNDELLDRYNIDKKNVEDRILVDIKKYYNYEVKKKYISDCDYECYKESLGDNIFDNINYFVKDNSLYAYSYFLIDSAFAYDGNNPFDLFIFKIS